MKPVTPEKTLRATYHEVLRMLDDLPPASRFYDGSWIDAHQKHKELLERDIITPLTRDRGMKVKSAWNGAAVTLCGIRSTSTSSVENALRNWCAAARRRLPDCEEKGQ